MSEQSVVDTQNRSVTDERNAYRSQRASDERQRYRRAGVEPHGQCHPDRQGEPHHNRLADKTRQESEPEQHRRRRGKRYPGRKKPSLTEEPGREHSDLGRFDSREVDAVVRFNPAGKERDNCCACKRQEASAEERQAKLAVLPCGLVGTDCHQTLPPSG